MKTKACAILKAITDSESTAAAFCPAETLGLHALVLLNQEVSACIIKVTLFWQNLPAFHHVIRRTVQELELVVRFHLQLFSHGKSLPRQSILTKPLVISKVYHSQVFHRSHINGPVKFIENLGLNLGFISVI